MKRQLAVHQSFQYAQNVVNGTIPAPKYVIKQCEKFMEICDGKSGAEPAQAYRAKGFSNFKEIHTRQQPPKGVHKTKKCGFLKCLLRSSKRFCVAFFIGTKVQQVLFSGARRGFVA